MLNFFLRLIEPLRSQKWRDAQEQKAFEAVFEDVPSDRERKFMSEKELAELLSTCKAGTPAYTLIEHELSRRIAKIQAMPTYVGVLSGLAGVVLGAWLNSYFQQRPLVDCTFPAATVKSTENESLHHSTPPNKETISEEPIESLSGGSELTPTATLKNHNTLPSRTSATILISKENLPNIKTE